MFGKRQTGKLRHKPEVLHGFSVGGLELSIVQINEMCQSLPVKERPVMLTSMSRPSFMKRRLRVGLTLKRR